MPYRSLKAFGCSLLAALGSGALLGHVHGTLGPPNASQLEVAAAALARCPWVAQALAAVASLGMPFVEETMQFKIATQNQTHTVLEWLASTTRQNGHAFLHIKEYASKSARIFQDTQRALGRHSTPGVK